MDNFTGYIEFCKNKLFKNKWHLVFVDQYGKTVRIPNFQRMVVAIAAVAVIAVAVAVVMFFFFAKSKNANDALSTSLTEAQERVSELREENDLLRARLVVLRDKLPAEAKPALPDSKRKDTADEKPQETGEKPQSSAAGQKGKMMGSDQPTGVVEVNQFGLSREPFSDRVKINFRVHKADETRQAVSGRAFVVLTPAGDSGSAPQVVPAAELQNGIPAQIEKGQYFSIERFKPITLKARGIRPAQLEKATVMIFSPEENLLCKKQFECRLSAE